MTEAEKKAIRKASASLVGLGSMQKIYQKQNKTSTALHKKCQRLVWPQRGEEN